MNAARLEELAAWAQSQADWCKAQDIPLAIWGKYADLARCARAWATLNKLIHLSHSKATSFWVSEKGIGFLTPRSIHTAGTPIEVVEAAEVTNENKG